MARFRRTGRRTFARHPGTSKKRRTGSRTAVRTRAHQMPARLRRATPTRSARRAPRRAMVALARSPRPHWPIFAVQKFRHVRFKYVTSVAITATTGSWGHHAFHPDAAYLPDAVAAIGASVYGSSLSKSHQPYGWDQWEPVYQLAVVKSCSIRIDLIDFGGSDVNDPGLYGVKLMNQHTLTRLINTGTDTGGSIADNHVERNNIRGGFVFPAPASKSRMQKSARWNYRRWHGPRVSLSRGYQSTSLTVYEEPFSDEISSGVTHYQKPLFVVYCMATSAGVDPLLMEFRVTLWYDVLMKHRDDIGGS